MKNEITEDHVCSKEIGCRKVKGENEWDCCKSPVRILKDPFPMKASDERWNKGSNITRKSLKGFNLHHASWFSQLSPVHQQDCMSDIQEIIDRQVKLLLVTEPKG